MSFEQILEKKRVLLAEIKRVRSGLDRLPYLDTMVQERWNRHERIENMKSRYGSDASKWPGHVQADYHNFKATIDSAASKIQAAKDKKAQINARLEDLQEQLDALHQQITVEDLLPMQANVTDLSQKIENLKVLVAEEEGRVAAGGQGNDGTLLKLTKEKEDLLADIACGESADHERLAAINLEISQEEERRDNQAKTLVTSSQKIAGLTRKIKQIGGELSVAEQNLADGLAVFLGQELEKAGEAYVKQAGNLASAYSKVIAIATILEKCGAPINVFGPYTRGFKIPSFLLDSCMAHDITDTPGLLFQFNGSAVQEQLDTEIERFGRIGISIPDGMPASL